jgi:hypothetical protein
MVVLHIHMIGYLCCVDTSIVLKWWTVVSCGEGSGQYLIECWSRRLAELLDGRVAVLRRGPSEQ